MTTVLDKPQGVTKVARVVYLDDTDTLIVGEEGHDEEGRPSMRHLSRVFVCKDYLAGNRETVSFAPAAGREAACMAVVGHYIFTGGWKERGRLGVNRLSDGAKMGVFDPGETVARPRRGRFASRSFALNHKLSPFGRGFRCNEQFSGFRQQRRTAARGGRSEPLARERRRMWIASAASLTRFSTLMGFNYHKRRIRATGLNRAVKRARIARRQRERGRIVEGEVLRARLLRDRLGQRCLAGLWGSVEQ